MALKHPRLPAIRLDPADRRILGIALVVVLAFVLLCLTIGAGVGLAVRAFYLLSGLGG